MVKDDDLVVATHGRSFWVLDDITPLRQVNAQIAQADMILYQPQTACVCTIPTKFDHAQPAGENPPPGAMIDYYFKTAPKDEVTLDILDAQGKLVRHLSSKEKKETSSRRNGPTRCSRSKTIPAKAGMNRFAWDLRYDDPVQTPGAFYAGESAGGPLVLPGDYQVSLPWTARSRPRRSIWSSIRARQGRRTRASKILAAQSGRATAFRICTGDQRNPRNRNPDRVAPETFRRATRK